jgi:pimeloyl-ACP methyl ester carboxylesterase
MDRRPTLLLVHGAWHGPWYWEATIAALHEYGLAATTVALPSCGVDPATLGGLVEDIAAVEEAAATIDGDAVVVGHSYGGMVVTGASFGGNVRRLVYVAAFMPAEGRSLVSHFPPDALPPFVDILPDGSVGFVQGYARNALYGDLDTAAAEAATRRLVLHSAAAITTPVQTCAWRSIPSTYIVCTEDRIIPPAVQHEMAANARETRILAASHSPMLSRPSDLAALLAEVATARGEPRHLANAAGMA